MQSVSSRIWTCVAMSIYYEDKHNTTDTSIYICVCVCVCLWVCVFFWYSFLMTYKNYGLHTFPKSIYPKENGITLLGLLSLYIYIYTQTCGRDTQLAGAVEYTGWLCAEGYPHNVCPGYDTKEIWWWVSGDAGAFGNAEYPFIAAVPWSTLPQCGNTC